MSELAARERLRKQGWAAPGGAHDYLVRFLKIALPAAIGVLLAYLLITPMSKGPDISFILDKNSVEVASERMRVQTARYRGQDARGRPFIINAQSAVQVTSRDPVLDIEGMAAEIALDDGPATLRANRGRYDMESEKVAVAGPVVFTAAQGYRLATSDVTIDLDQRTLASNGPVQGRMPLGRFSANRLTANLPQRHVTLTGNARLHIVQGAIR